jgi:peptide/nickel transport system substrate-binding protein
VQTPPSALDPHYHNTTNNNMALRHIFEGLFEAGPDAKLQPSLAEDLRNIDATTWEVKLRPGVRFHDGTPLEAEDIAFTFARVPTVPNSPALFTPQVRTISAIEIKDPQTVVIRTREPNPLLHFDLSGPAILSRKVHGPSPSTSTSPTGGWRSAPAPTALSSTSTTNAWSSPATRTTGRRRNRGTAWCSATSPSPGRAPPHCSRARWT